MMRSGDTTFGHYHSTLRVVPLFETLSDLAGCQASMRRLFECEWCVPTHGICVCAIPGHESCFSRVSGRGRGSSPACGSPPPRDA